MYTFNGWIMWYVNYTPIWLLKMKANSTKIKKMN